MNSKHIGSTWDEVRKQTFTKEEIKESNLRVALIEDKVRG